MSDLNHTLRKRLLTALVILWLVALAATFLSGSHHDYREYSKVWTSIADRSAPPWGPDSMNAYGPLFNLLALPHVIHPLLPKILFTAAWLASLTYILLFLAREKADNFTALLAVACLVLNPLFWVHTVLYGNFDALPAALCLASLVLRTRRRDVSSGVLLALAVLLKFYPLAMAPFMAFDRRRFNLRFTASFILTLAAGFLASFALYGPSTFYPLRFAAERPSKGLSLFRFLRGDFSPLRLFTDSPDVDYLSTPATVLAGAVVFALSLKWRLRTFPAALLGILTGLTVFKVGHAQFIPVVVFSLWYYFAADRINARSERRLAAAATAYSLYIGATAAVYFVTGLLRHSAFGFMGPYEFFRSIIGLPAFILATFLALEIFRREIPRLPSATAALLKNRAAPSVDR